MSEEEENVKRAVRVFVGGIGEAVTADDIRRLFESLGTVQSLETIRTKGRSLTYLDFLSDPKSLSKLFSKYNGCVWKGGKLRLEKAKEHYLDRLKKEWEQDAILNVDTPTTDISTHKEDLEKEKEKPNARRLLDSNAKTLNIYFPRLRTVKSIPFSGTGKHKYSFQNIKVPPLPVNFCDCEEHCSPFVPNREKVSMNAESEIGGINDEEINIMNAVMNKLFEKEKVSDTKHIGKKRDSFDPPAALHSNECEVDSATDDDDDDDDDLIINIETKKNKAAFTGTQELERIMENKESRSNKKNIAEEEPIELQKRSNSNPNKIKKQKSLPKLESESNGASQPTEAGYNFGESGKVSWSQKSSWRELVGKGGNASFSTSFILPTLDSGKDQQNSDGSCTSSSTKDEIEDIESGRDLEVKSDENEDVESDGYIESNSDENEDEESDGYLESKIDESEDMESDEYPQSKSDESEDMESDEYLESKGDESEDMESDGYLESKHTDAQVIEEPSEAQPTYTRVIDECGGSQPANTQVIEEPAEAQPTNKQAITEPSETQNNTAPKITGAGASWLQKKSWTQLINENNNSFSITQILPGFTFPEQTANEPILPPADDTNNCTHNAADKNTVNATVTDGFNLGEIVPENNEHASSDDIVSAPVVEKSVETSPRKTSSANVKIGETCSFMRSAASLKEWSKAKAAVSGSLKRKRGEK